MELEQQLAAAKARRDAAVKALAPKHTGGEHCIAAKLGSPNDEVLHGHPLAGKGLDGYTAQLVRNSRWLAELQKINSVHARYLPDAWQQRNHYVFWFHDSTFECIAESYAVELHVCSFPELLVEACRRSVK